MARCFHMCEGLHVKCGCTGLQIFVDRVRLRISRVMVLVTTCHIHRSAFSCLLNADVHGVLKTDHFSSPGGEVGLVRASG